MSLRILHSTHAWLKTTENWVSRLISNVPGAENSILSREFLPTAPKVPPVDYVQWPLSKFEIQGNGSSAFIWKAFRKIFRIYETSLLSQNLIDRYDILHSHFSFVGWESMPLAKRLKIPHVVSFYGFDYEYLPYTDPKWVGRYRKMFKEIDLFLCEGEHGVSILKKAGCPSEKIMVARLGVSTDEIQFAEKLPDRKVNGFRLVQIASLTGKKGHQDAICAVAKAIQFVPDLHFTIVGGEGDVKAQNLLSLAKKLGIEDHVEWIPAIDFSKLHSFLTNFHGFLHPSKYTEDRNCEGGAPVVLLDAQAVGLPVISTTHCDIPDEVLQGKTGYLANEGDIQEIANNIIRLSQLSPIEYQMMRTQAREHVEMSFNSKYNGELLGKIYNELLLKNRSHRK